MYEAQSEFQEGWGDLEKFLLWGRYGYFVELHNLENSDHMPQVYLNLSVDPDDSLK